MSSSATALQALKKRKEALKIHVAFKRTRSPHVSFSYSLAHYSVEDVNFSHSGISLAVHTLLNSSVSFDRSFFCQRCFVCRGVRCDVLIVASWSHRKEKDRVRKERYHDLPIPELPCFNIGEATGEAIGEAIGEVRWISFLWHVFNF